MDESVVIGVAIGLVIDAVVLVVIGEGRTTEDVVVGFGLGGGSTAVGFGFGFGFGGGDGICGAGARLCRKWVDITIYLVRGENGSKK